MSAKNLDKRGRWRNVSVGFKMSPEEAKLLDVKVAISGLSKQDYIINRLLEREIVVQANPKVYIALKRQLEKVLEELKANHQCKPSDELLEIIRQINQTLYGMKGEKNDCP